MRISDIIESVASKVQDSAFDDDAILSLINEARHVIASIVYLPALQTSGTVITSSAASSVDLPVDFSRGLYWVWSSAQNRRIGKMPGDYYNMLSFTESFPVVVGSIDRVCVEGASLLYNGMADDTLTLKYYAAPVDIATNLNLEPSEIPSHLQRPLLSAYCNREMFSIIEDGMEGNRSNTSFWDNEFSRQMSALELFIMRNTPREPKFIRQYHGL